MQRIDTNMVEDDNLEFEFADKDRRGGRVSSPHLSDKLIGFDDFGKKTRLIFTGFTSPDGASRTVETFVNEFWTAKQRAASRLHEVSYRACFKPQLPRFFIEHLTQPGATVYDPFMGRGTTLIEAALLGRVPASANDYRALIGKPELTTPTKRRAAQLANG